MRDFYRDTVVMTDPSTGALMSLAGVEVFVYNAGTSVRATIFQGREGAAELPNPFTTTVDGLVEFYAEEGRYDVQYKDTVSPPRTGEIIKLWNAVDPVVDSGDLDPTVVTFLVPVGLLAPFAGANAPTGWKICDGSPINRVDFAALFSVIGVTYGAGNGTSTFNLPDLRGRVSVGAGTAVGDATATVKARGVPGGAEKHLLTGPESGTAIHGHGHGLSASGGGSHGHTITVNDNYVLYQGDGVARRFPFTNQGDVWQLGTGPTGAHPRAGMVTGTTYVGSTAGSHGHTAGASEAPNHTHPVVGSVSDAANAQATQAHSSLQPYSVFNHIIKY